MLYVNLFSKKIVFKASVTIVKWVIKLVDLVCQVCGYRTLVPTHHGVPMRPIKEGFIKKKVIRLECESCDRSMPVPIHCGKPMIYIEEKKKKKKWF